jgi:hypothetical protein
MGEDPYWTLQVAPSADLEAIHAAYRRLARQYHPDLNPGVEAAARMRAINAAYHLLSDPRQRAVYDARRYLPRRQRTVTVTAAPPRRPVVIVAHPPTQLQRRVDRIVAVLGVLLLISIGFYTVNVIPYAERQFQAERAGTADRLPTPAPADHTSSGAVPERLRSDAGLRSFPGTVLVAPSNLEPFANLPIFRLDANGRGIARYAVYYGDLTNGGASISGLTSRAAFDTAVPRLPNCPAEATYCVGPAPGQAAGPPGLELFRTADLVAGNPAFVTHRVCCNGVFWSLSWYDSRADMSYAVDLSRSVAERYGTSAAEADVSAAHAVAALAAQLVKLPVP